jgi:transcription initiation factor TFIIB
MVKECWECKSNSIIFDDNLGETICDDCGLVLMQNALEETIGLTSLDEKTSDYMGRTNSSFNLGSMISIKDLNSKQARVLYNTQRWNQTESPSQKKMMKLCNMALSNYNVRYEIKERVPRYYKTLQTKHALRGVSIEVRAAALTYYILKEISIATTIKRHSNYTRVTEKEISKNARIVATFLGKPWVFSQININGLVDNVGQNLFVSSLILTQDAEYLGDVKRLAHQANEILDMHCERLTIAYLSACFYLVSIFNRKHYSQVQIALACGTTEVSLRSNLNKLLAIYGIEKETLPYLTLNDFIGGIR